MKRLLIIIVLLVIVILAYSFTLQKKVSTITSVTSVPRCGVAQKIFIGQSQERYLIFCDKGVYISKYVTDSTADYSLVESEASFPDLFSYYKHAVIATAEMFPQTNPKFIALIANYDTGLSYKQAIGIYRINDYKAIRAFKKGFDDVNGRWTGFELSNSELEITIIGDIGSLRCSGCRIEWVDYFKWNETSNTFELNNAAHIADYRKLLEKYGQYALDSADQKSQQTFIIAKMTIEKIISGNNITLTKP